MGPQFPVFQIASPALVCAAGLAPPIGRGDGAEIGIPPFVLTSPRDADPVLQTAWRRLGRRVSDAVIVAGEGLTGNRIFEAYLKVLRRFRAEDRADSLRATAGEIDFAGVTPTDDAADAYRYYTLYFDGDGRPLVVRCNNPLVPSARVEPGVVALGSAVSCGGQVIDMSTLLEMVMGLDGSDRHEVVLRAVEEAALSLEAGALVLADNRGRDRSADVPGEFFDALWCYLSAVRGSESREAIGLKYGAFARTLSSLPRDLFGESYS